MNLESAITKFKETSGRYDMTDVAITEWLNNAIRLLDSRVPTCNLNKEAHVDVTTDQFSVSFTDAIEVKHVYIRDDTRRTELTYCTGNDFSGYRAATVSSMAAGRPAYYTNTSHRVSTTIISAGQDFMDLNGTAVCGLLFSPKADADYVMVIEGTFFHEALVELTDTNFWLDNHIETVNSAAHLLMEMSYRNSEGLRDNFLALGILIDPISRLYENANIAHSLIMGDVYDEF